MNGINLCFLFARVRVKDAAIIEAPVWMLSGWKTQRKSEAEDHTMGKF